MKSHATKGFWDAFRALPPDVRKLAYAAYREFARDPFAPSLHFKETSGKRGVWSARISLQYRALGIRKGDEITWTWIGTHREYDKRI